MRLLTFRNCDLKLPHELVHLLAFTGFEYLSQGIVRCKNCKLLLFGIKDTSFVNAHKYFSPHCPLTQHSSTTTTLPIYLQDLLK
jgi:hypothetical protein